MPQNFKQEIYFKQLTGFIFYIPQKKAVSVIRHIHNNTEHKATEHFMHVTQLLSAPWIIIAGEGIIYYSVGFPPWKEMALLEKCNQLWREICDFLWLYTAWNGNSYHHCTACPLKMGPERCPKTSITNQQYMMCNIPEDWRSQYKKCIQNFSP